MIAGGVIGSFEDTLEAVVAVAFFIPVIIDMGGNVATQSSTIFVRRFALGHVDRSRFIPYLSAELKVGVTLGPSAVSWSASWPMPGRPCPGPGGGCFDDAHGATGHRNRIRCTLSAGQARLGCGRRF